MTVICLDAYLEPAYTGQDVVTCILEDISRDSVSIPGSGSGQGAIAHTISLVAVPSNRTEGVTGYQVVLGETTMSLYGGQRREFLVTAQATPQITGQDYAFDLIANYTSADGYNETIIVPFSVQVQPYDFAVLRVLDLSKEAGQDEVVTYTIEVQNTGVYLDSFTFDVEAPPGYFVTVPPNLFVPAGETRTTNISILTPRDKLFELGTSVSFSIKARSTMGTGVYSGTGLLQMRGPHFPTHTIPLLLVGLVSAAVLVRGTREKTELHRMEKGRPRPVQVTPRQAVLLAELRRSDVVAYKEKKASLDSVYRERITDYREHRKERLAADRAEARQARAEFVAAKKARKVKRAELKREKKRLDAEQRRAAKLERKQAKRDAKLLKKKEKVLNKKRSQLEKQKAKADARQAKLDTKALKAQQAAERKAAKEAKKRAK